MKERKWICMLLSPLTEQTYLNKKICVWVRPAGTIAIPQNEEMKSFRTNAPWLHRFFCCDRECSLSLRLWASTGIESSVCALLGWWNHVCSWASGVLVPSPLPLHCDRFRCSLLQGRLDRDPMGGQWHLVLPFALAVPLRRDQTGGRHGWGLKTLLPG